MNYEEYKARIDTWSFQVISSESMNIERVNYSDLSSTFTRMKVLNRYRNVIHWKEFRCFFTNIEPHLVHPICRNNTSIKFPFAATIEHLVPLRHYHIHGQALQNKSNDFLAIYMANRLADHKPLLIKLLNRKSLLSANLTMEDLKANCYKTLIDIIEPNERDLEINGIRPWNPQATNKDMLSNIVNDFMSQMYKAETEFLSLPYEQKMKWIDEFNLDNWI